MIVLVSVAIIAIGVVVGLAVYFNLKVCPRCKARRIGYLHQRVEGGPDRRFKNNPYICRACGWRGYSLDVASHADSDKAPVLLVPVEGETALGRASPPPALLVPLDTESAYDACQPGEIIVAKGKLLTPQGDIGVEVDLVRDGADVQSGRAKLLVVCKAKGPSGQRHGDAVTITGKVVQKSTVKGYLVVLIEDCTLKST